MAARPAESVYLSSPSPPFSLATLSTADVLTYLDRLGLARDLIDESPSLELLSTLLTTHQLQVPYDSSSLHVTREAWLGPNAAIQLGRGEGMKLGKGNFERITRSNTGGYCFALLTAFASLLRAFGFSVSDIGARVYMNRGQDPREVGYLWSALTHHVLLVSWPESKGKRYLVDVGFGGGGCPYPQLLEDGTTTGSLSRCESFLLREEQLAIDGHHPDAAHGWTFYRRVLPRGEVVESPEKAGEGAGYWSPCYHFSLSTMSPDDILMLNHYNESHPQAVWMNAFCVSRLLPTGARRTIMYTVPLCKAKCEEEGREMIKVWTKEGIKGEEYDVEWVPFETGPVREVLENQFGFKF